MASAPLSSELTEQDTSLKFADALRDVGWLDSVLYVLHTAFLRLTRSRLLLLKYYFVAQPIAAKSLLSPARGRNVAVHQVRPGDAAIALFPRDPAIIRKRFDSGAQCLCAMKQGGFAGFLWWQTGAYDEDEARCRFRPVPAEETVWDFDVHVEPAERGGMVLPRLWDEANALLRDRGVRWTVSRISAFNPASLSSHARMGALPIGSACFALLGRWQIMWASVHPFLHLSSGTSSCPELVLDVRQSKNYRRFRRFSRRH